MTESSDYSYVATTAPFLILNYFYFTAYVHQAESLFNVLVKCLPIWWLVAVLATTSVEAKYGRKILLGLALSSLGDAFLVYKETFLAGMAAFAAAHVFYIYAFGFRQLWSPKSVRVAISCIAFGMIMYLPLHRHLKDVFCIAVPVYAVLLTSMLWRSLSRHVQAATSSSLLAAIGAFSFAVSDSVLAFSLFHPNFALGSNKARIFIMVTYYAGQFLIATSVLAKQKKEKQT